MWLGTTTLVIAVLDLALLFSENHWPSQSVPNRATQLCLASGPPLLTSQRTGGSQVKLNFDFWASAGLSLLSQPRHFPISLVCHPALRSPLSLGRQGWSATRLFILTAAFPQASSPHAAFPQASSPHLLHQKPPNERASCFSWRDLPVLSLDLARLKSDFISPALNPPVLHHCLQAKVQSWVDWHRRGPLQTGPALSPHVPPGDSRFNKQTGSPGTSPSLWLLDPSPQSPASTPPPPSSPRPH